MKLSYVNLLYLFSYINIQKKRCITLNIANFNKYGNILFQTFLKFPRSDNYYLEQNIKIIVFHINQ